MALHRVEEVTQLEHVDDGGVERKRIGLFAKDFSSGSVLELSALSTASGAMLLTKSLDPAAGSSLATVSLNANQWVGAQSLPTISVGALPSIYATVQVYSASTIYAVVNTGSSTNLTSLASGTEVRSLATILNFPSLISLASGTEVRSLVTLFPRTDYLGLMSVSGNVVNSAGANYIGLASVNIGGTLPVLTAGSNYVGLASVNVGGNLPAGTNYIGLASVNVGGNLPAGTNYIGLASVNIGGTLPALTAGTAFIGLASVSGNVGITGLVSLPSGTQLGGITSLPSINANIGTPTVMIGSPFNSTASAVRVADGGTRQIAGSYRFGSSQMSGATGTTSMFSIENPTGSGVNVYIKRMELQSIPLSVASIPMVMRIGRVMLMPISGPSTFYQKSNTSASTGGRAIVRQYFPVASLATGSMWTGNFGMRLTDVGAWTPQPSVIFSEPRETDDVVLAPNEALLVQQDANLGGLVWRHSLDMSWDEGLG